MNDLDPDRFTLRQVDQAREAYAQVMEELELVKEQLARLPTRSETPKAWRWAAWPPSCVALLLIR